MGGRELGRRFTDSAGSRRGHGGENAILRSHGREQPRMDSTGRRQERAAGSRGQQEQQARRGRRQEQRAARLPSFLCTNTFVAVLVLVPIMYLYEI